MPGLIDAHIHLFLHPGPEGEQTVVESVPQRTIMATLAAQADLMAGFTAERDMGTEGAGSADTAVRDAINDGHIPGPRLRISGNAIDILGGHEDANNLNPAQHVLSNAAYANSAEQLVEVIRGQVKEGADFIKIYEFGEDSLVNGKLSTRTSTLRRSWPPLSKKPPGLEGGLRCMPPESRARSMLCKRVSFRSITHFSSATRRCASCGRRASPLCRRSRSPNTLPSMLTLRRQPIVNASCRNSTLGNSKSNWPQACRWWWGRMLVPFRTARRRASSS